MPRYNKIKCPLCGASTGEEHYVSCNLYGKIVPSNIPNQKKLGMIVSPEEFYPHFERLRQKEKYIGFWSYELNPGLPNPKDYIDESWSENLKNKIANYLDAGKMLSYYHGCSSCRICGKTNGNKELTDGKFIWPEGFSHYVRDHSVRPPDYFVNYVINKCRK